MVKAFITNKKFLFIRTGDHVQHFKIFKNEERKYYLWIRKFSSLNMLVEHHKTNSVSNNQQIFLSDTDLRVSYMCAFNVIHIGPIQEFGDLSCEQCSLVGDFFKISLSSEYSLQCI